MIGVRKLSIWKKFYIHSRVSNESDMENIHCIMVTGLEKKNLILKNE
jgi:hypothetical protein